MPVELGVPLGGSRDLPVLSAACILSKGARLGKGLSNQYLDF